MGDMKEPKTLSFQWCPVTAEEAWADLKQVVPRGCGVSTLEDIQNSPGRRSGQQAPADPT